MDKKTLIKVIEALELEVEVKITTTPSKLRLLVKDSIIRVFELEGDESEINESISQMIENAFSGDDEGTSSQTDEEDNSTQQEEQEVKPKGGTKSLMEKYATKK